ncbi:MAG: hypothetical protein RIC38_03090 [Chromatocurvus sp.]
MRTATIAVREPGKHDNTDELSSFRSVAPAILSVNADHAGMLSIYLYDNELSKTVFTIVLQVLFSAKCV